MSKHTDTERLEYLVANYYVVDSWRGTYSLSFEEQKFQRDDYLDFRSAIDAAMDGKDVPD